MFNKVNIILVILMVVAFSFINKAIDGWLEGTFISSMSLPFTLFIAFILIILLSHYGVFGLVKGS